MGMTPSDATMPRGTLHLHGAHDEAAMDGLPASTFRPGSNFAYTYGNDQAATGLWYYDHSWGLTRLQVTAGLAGQYWLRDNYDTGAADNPLGLPSGANELPLTLQDPDLQRRRDVLLPGRCVRGAGQPGRLPRHLGPGVLR